MLGHIEQPGRRHRKNSDSVDASFSHRCEISFDDGMFGELLTMAARSEGAISDTFDEVFSFSNEEELAVDADGSGRVEFPRPRRQRLSRTLFEFN